MKIAILGITGFTGSAIAMDALSRGWEVQGVARHDAGISGATTIVGSVEDTAVLDRAIAGADVVVGALSILGGMRGKLTAVYQHVADTIQGSDTRFILVAGHMSLKDADGNYLADLAREQNMDAPWAYEALENVRMLLATSGVQYTIVAPPVTYGAMAPALPATGRYVISNDVAKDQPESISGADFAKAVNDIASSGSHPGEIVGILAAE
ncbi:NAD(P)-dependent oxidoreductase [Neoactinobaculum massilliense]|uniref:NAD(P)-dependent oxidoreductase n=1 Tax=Neoactinobaculum massilliense TaxID=2364794 RepID=UPI000F536710|nr:NAD(P)H-binding protein [Neoactinobaculum massilliense]